MEAKGYRVAGIGEGIDHSTGKQNYIGVTLDIAACQCRLCEEKSKCMPFKNF